MEYTVEIINFGKIKHAKLQFNDLTAFAGTNNTGKSYASRIIYSIFSALTDNPEQYYQDEFINAFFRDVSRASTNFSRGNKPLDNKSSYDTNRHRVSMKIQLQLRSYIRVMSRKLIENVSDRDLFSTSEGDHDGGIQPLTDKVQTLIDKLKDMAKKAALDNHMPTKVLNDYYQELDNCLANLHNELDKDTEHTIIKGYANKFKKNLLHNFQAEELKDLLGDEKKDASIKINSPEGDDIRLAISKSGEITDVYVDVIDYGVYCDVVYLESPIYWKLRDKLSNLLFLDRTIDRGRQLDGVPKYFQDLIEKMGNRQITEIADVKIKEKLTDEINDIIGGQIREEQNTGELQFFEGSASSKKNIKGVSLHLTATGVSQLGMLAYFIDKKVIRKGTILFVDEPEVHLHPEWQDKMMEVLYSFTQHGVKVIMATHSPTMIQRLGVFKKQEKTPQRISLNFFDKIGKFDTTKKTYEEINDEIGESLERPAYNIYLRSL